MVVSKMKVLSIIIPAYNEEKTISKILKRLNKVDLKDIKKEIVVVDDGSTDRTYEILEGFGVMLIKHEKNLGKGAAIRSGIKNSSGDMILIQDADLEYSPEEIPSLVNEILNGEDVVYGSRFKGSIRNMSFFNYLANQFLSFTTRILFNTPISDIETGYKIFKRNVIDKIDLDSKGFEIEAELTTKILKKKYRIKEVPISYNGRNKKEKKIKWKDGIRTLFCLLKHRGFDKFGL